MAEIDTASQLILPTTTDERKEHREAAGILTWKSRQIIEGRRAQRLIPLSDGRRVVKQAASRRAGGDRNTPASSDYTTAQDAALQD